MTVERLVYQMDDVKGVLKVVTKDLKTADQRAVT